MIEQPVATKNPQHTLVVDTWEYIAPTSPHGRGTWLDRHYDHDDPYPRKWAFRNGSNHRPQFEDRILKKIDDERKLAKLREDVSERERSAREVPTPALSEELRAVRDRGQCLGVEEAKILIARQKNYSSGPRVRDWHAPRTDSGLPEGTKEKA